jgi:hypothetical protein
MIYAYGNSGGIDDVKKRLINPPYFKFYNCLYDLIHTLTNISYFGNSIKAYKDLSIKHYGYDDRLNKQIFMVTANHSGLKNQFVCYFIEEETK